MWQSTPSASVTNWWIDLTGWPLSVHKARLLVSTSFVGKTVFQTGPLTLVLWKKATRTSSAAVRISIKASAAAGREHPSVAEKQRIVRKRCMAQLPL